MHRHYIPKRLIRLRDTGFFHVFGSNVINKIVATTYGLALLHIVDKPEFGIYKYANNIYGFFILLSGLGIESAILQICSEKINQPYERDSIFRYGMNVGLRVNFILALAILLTALFIPLPISGSNLLLGVMFLMPMVTILKNMQMIQLRTTLRNKEYAWLNSADSIAVALCAVIGAYFFKTMGVVIGFYIASCLVVFLAVRKLQCKIELQQKVMPPPEIGLIRKIAGISVLNESLSQASGLLGTFFLGLVRAQESAIAAYTAALMIPTALAFIPNALVVYIYPYFAKNKENKAWVRANYWRTTIAIGVLNLLITLPSILLAPWFIPKIFGAAYADTVLPFRILMLSYLIQGTFRQIAGNLLVTQRKLQFNLLMGILGTVISIACNLWLIPPLASVGAALSQLITMTVLSICVTVYFLRVIHLLPSNGSTEKSDKGNAYD